MKNTLLLFLSNLVLSLSLSAQDAKKDFTTSSISIFKNGTAFFIKSGTVKPTEGVYRIKKNLPPALSATFWVTSPNNQLDYITGFVDTLESTQQNTVTDMFDLLSANLGKKVRLHIGKDEIVEGIAQDIGRNTLNAGDPVYSLMSLQMDGRWMALNKKEIRRIEFFEKPTQVLKQDKKEVKPVLEVYFNKQRSEQPLDMMYLSRGLNWTPTYLIELISETKARLALRAEVTNETEDIKGSTVNFVVGVPNFRDANSFSSLVNLMMDELNTRGLNRPQNFSNIAQTQVYSTFEDINPIQSIPAGSATGLEGSSAEDLYFYTLKDMNLKKGGRGQYPVFEAEINIDHIYECNLPQNNERKNYYQSEYLFTPNPNKVFHSIKVNNTTPYPFTTGPALVVINDGETKPISQDRLNYTSINDHSFVKLTEAPDVRIKQAEKAVDRKERVRKITRQESDYFYDLLSVEGQIVVRNYKDKKIDLNIRRPIIGDLKSSNVKWLKAERINTSGSLNKTTDVCWETSVDAGGELTINYSYQIYVLH